MLSHGRVRAVDDLKVKLKPQDVGE
jgi:hypothetical protein